MKKNIAIGVLIIFFGTALYFNITNARRINIRDLIMPYSKDINVENSNLEFGAYVFADGTWVASNKRENHDFLNDQVNTSHIYCDKDTKKCHEERALLSRFSKKQGVAAGKYDLFAHAFEYDVQEWTKNYLKARLTGPGRIFELTINFNTKTALLSISDNPNNPTSSMYVNTATLENGFDVWDSLRQLNI